MKIPDKLKIGGHWFEVIKAYDRLKLHGSDDEGASTNFYSRIWIDTSMSKSEQEETLIHEIIEMINTMHDMKLNHQTISTLGEAIYQILIDNRILR